MKIGQVNLAEASGAVRIGGDRILLVGDEAMHVAVIQQAGATFATGQFKNRLTSHDDALATRVNLDDIEDVAWDAERQAAFLMTSHSVNKAEEHKEKRFKIARLLFHGDKLKKIEQSGTLEGALSEQFPFVKAALPRPHQIGGVKGAFNIEGATWVPDVGLLIGLRSPTFSPSHAEPGRAVALVLSNPHAIFDDKAAPRFEPQPRTLDLGGQGIRALEYDASNEGVWLIAGRSDNPDGPPTVGAKPWRLWFWDLKDGLSLLHTSGPADIANPEGLCHLVENGQPGLLLVEDSDDKIAPSRTQWLALSKLNPA